GEQGLLSEHCMVPAYGGTKMIVFGGWDGLSLNSEYAMTPFYSSTLYVLDIKSMSWSILSKGSVLGRRSMACTVVGDNFVAWGGMNLIVLTLKTNQWTDTYIVTVAEDPPSNNKLGIYIGVGIAVGIVLGALLGWIVFRYKRKSRTTQVSVPNASSQDLRVEKSSMKSWLYAQAPRDHPQNTDNFNNGLPSRNPQNHNS
ncbi:hypothetical protein FBU30_002987, partial [Linnemannia zychae]